MIKDINILTGIDIVKISRIENILNKYKKDFVNSVYLEDEIAYCESHKNNAGLYAVRFAAKEAGSKALGLGIDGITITYKDIEVTKADNGKPNIQFHGNAKCILKNMGNYKASLSLSHDGDYAVAYVAILVYESVDD